MCSDIQMLHQMTEMSKKKIIANLLNLQVGTLDHFLMLLVCCSEMEKKSFDLIFAQDKIG